MGDFGPNSRSAPGSSAPYPSAAGHQIGSLVGIDLRKMRLKGITPRPGPGEVKHRRCAGRTANYCSRRRRRTAPITRPRRNWANDLDLGRRR
jgi:hypothetical protein